MNYEVVNFPPCLKSNDRLPLLVISCHYLSHHQEEETVVLKFLVEMSKEEVENCNGYNTKATHIQTGRFLVLLGAGSGLHVGLFQFVLILCNSLTFSLQRDV